MTDSGVRDDGIFCIVNLNKLTLSAINRYHWIFSLSPQLHGLDNSGQMHTSTKTGAMNIVSVSELRLVIDCRIRTEFVKKIYWNRVGLFYIS